MNLKKINNYSYEIEKEGKMNVPVKIFASDSIMKNMEKDDCLKQGINVSQLPGIKKYSFMMPDAHQGYGFSIGGVAAFDLEEGIISPGGIGFDINCLSKDSKILTNEGYFKTIEEFEKDFSKELITLDLNSKKDNKSIPVLFMKKKNNKKMFKITTSSGKIINATEDHPIFTKHGMKNTLSLMKDEEIATYPFEGVEYEEPSNDFLITEEDILSFPSKFNKEQMIKELKQRNLLPLRKNDSKIPALIKLISYNMGDGSLVITGDSAMIWYWGKPEELELIREDVYKLGFTPSKIYSRERHHSIDTKYGNVSFDNNEYSMKITSRSLLTLMAILGAPLGKKTIQNYGIPFWLKTAPKWHKRLFLASYFGAEMSSPNTMTNNHSTFYMPTVGINKSSNNINGGIKFLEDMKSMLEEFEIHSVLSTPKHDYTNKKNEKSYRVRIHISADNKNLLNLYKQINFEYNPIKRKLANLAIQYTLLKENLIQKRIEVQKQAITLKQNGSSISEICDFLCDDQINRRFIERSLYETRKTNPRIGDNLPIFKDFSESNSFGESGAVWDSIQSIEQINYDDYVYDFTVNHSSHNFIADNIVVSNCGVRLLSTNLTLDDVQPKIKELLDLLYKEIPSGVGEEGLRRLTDEELFSILKEGPRYLVEKENIGTKEELDHCEENGELKDADPNCVTQRAKSRGRRQLGTLGAGNHFVEVQVVGEIFDKKIAKEFGITKINQICLMIHTGSRGLGHQVASDYLRMMEDEYPEVISKLPEKDLIYAPFKSDLGQKYYKAMCASANFAWANRHYIANLAKNPFKKLFPHVEFRTVYDVAHNIAKIETHKIDGKDEQVLIHRKGATRSLGPENPLLPSAYLHAGQPIIIPGSMGTSSFLLVGTKESEDISFSSTAHGAGRLMSRFAAKKEFSGEEIKAEMEKDNIFLKVGSVKAVADEAPKAYKDVDEVVKISHEAKIGNLVAKLKPLGVIKG
jgi:tRNA-splicing ligase RtcB (3'-phosphate/5'-hydroxy nucleic acid ligase)